MTKTWKSLFFTSSGTGTEGFRAWWWRGECFLDHFCRFSAFFLFFFVFFSNFLYSLLFNLIAHHPPENHWEPESFSRVGAPSLWENIYCGKRRDLRQFADEQDIVRTIKHLQVMTEQETREDRKRDVLRWSKYFRSLETCVFLGPEYSEIHAADLQN